MAEEHKKKKRKPRRITTTRHDDGTYSHEHMHDNGKHALFAGTSQDMADLHQHMEDHFGGAEEPQAEAEPAPAEDAGAAGAGE